MTISVLLLLVALAVIPIALLVGFYDLGRKALVKARVKEEERKK